MAALVVAGAVSPPGPDARGAGGGTAIADLLVEAADGSPSAHMDERALQRGAKKRGGRGAAAGVSGARGKAAWGDAGGRRGGRRGTIERARPDGGRLHPGGGGAIGEAGGEVLVGVEAIEGRSIQARARAVGLNLKPSDLRAVAEAVTAHVNATGGIGGRRLRIRVYEHDPFDGQPYDAHIRQVCEAFGHGPRPVAVVAVAAETLARCLRPHGIPVITSETTTTGELAALADHLFAPSTMALDRFARPYVQSLKARGFFGRGARVGLGRPTGDQFFDDVAESLKRALDEEGVRVENEEKIPIGGSAQELGAAAALITASVLKAQAKRINRVIGFDVGGGFAVFMAAAEAQGYRPRYGANTTWAPAFLQSAVPDEQLEDAIGVGWLPLLDVDAARDDAVPDTRAECAGIFSRAGVDPRDRDVLGQQPAFAYCDVLLSLRAALARSAGVRAGLEAIVEPRGAATALATRFGATRHDGAAGLRAFEYDTGCRCIRYSGPTRVFD